MPIYLFCCDICHLQADVIRPMSECSDPGPSCPGGHGSMRRLYTVPADHSENTFKARWDDQLSRNLDGSPVYIKSRRELNERMEKLHVRPYEKGDGERYVKYRQDEEKKAEERLKKSVSDACDKAFDKVVGA